MNLGGDGPFQTWNKISGIDWLGFVIMILIVFFGCGFFSWLFGG